MDIQTKKEALVEKAPEVVDEYVTFHEQQECVYDFPSLSLATRASSDFATLA